MCADNNLEATGLKDVNEMEPIGSTADVNVLVQIDRAVDPSGGGVGYITDPVGDWTGARRYYIRADQDPNVISSQPDGDIRCRSQCQG